jgi:hypothetical protein
MRTTPDAMTRLVTAALLAALVAAAGCSASLHARSAMTGAQKAHSCTDFACEH